MNSSHYVHDIWISPVTGEDVQQCPWFRKLPNKDKYICRIHNVKLTHCRKCPHLERYPELKADQRFADLQRQLEGTENRIAVERRRFTENVAVYNNGVRRFPGRIIAGIFGFQEKQQFQAQQGADVAPKVEF